MKRNDIATRFQSKGVGVRSGAKPRSVLLPEELDSYIRNKPNRSEWLRLVIADAVAKEQASASNRDSFMDKQGEDARHQL